MKPRHAAALALVGWHLMWPPVVVIKGPGVHRPPTYDDVEAPLNQWTAVGPILKSEAECQQYRTSLDYWIVRYLPSQRKEALSASNVSPEERAKLEAFMVENADASKCVELNDPRLKPK